jgi:hypothetical protein
MNAQQKYTQRARISRKPARDNTLAKKFSRISMRRRTCRNARDVGAKPRRTGVITMMRRNNSLDCFHIHNNRSVAQALSAAADNRYSGPRPRDAIVVQSFMCEQP